MFQLINQRFKQSGQLKQSYKNSSCSDKSQKLFYAQKHKISVITQRLYDVRLLVMQSWKAELDKMKAALLTQVIAMVTEAGRITGDKDELLTFRKIC